MPHPRGHHDGSGCKKDKIKKKRYILNWTDISRPGWRGWISTSFPSLVQGRNALHDVQLIPGHAEKQASKARNKTWIAYCYTVSERTITPSLAGFGRHLETARNFEIYSQAGRPSHQRRLSIAPGSMGFGSEIGQEEKSTYWITTKKNKNKVWSWLPNIPQR